MDDEGIPDERPWRKREYSGASSTLGVAALIVLAVGAAIWYLEFRGDSGSALDDGAFGIVALDDALNPTDRAPAAEVGRAAPDFLLSMPDGGEAKLSDYRGRPVVLNFWASWCPPCRLEAPELEAAHLDNPDIVILGVNQQERDDDALAFREKFGVSFPMAMDRTGEVSKVYRASSPPTTIFISADGIVERLHVGPLTSAEIEEMVAEFAP